MLTFVCFFSISIKEREFVDILFSTFSYILKKKYAFGAIINVFKALESVHGKAAIFLFFFMTVYENGTKEVEVVIIDNRRFFLLTFCESFSVTYICVCSVVQFLG